MIFAKRAALLTTCIATGFFQGCATFGQNKIDHEDSIPKNILYTYAMVYDSDVADGPNGTDAYYSRTRSSLFDIMSMGLILSSGNLSELGSSLSVSHALRPSDYSNQHQHPLLFASIPYQKNDTEESAANRYFEIIENSVSDAFPNATEIIRMPSGYFDSMYYTAWQVVDSNIGCDTVSTCILRATINPYGVSGTTVASEWVDRQAFESLLDGKPPYKVKEAPYYSAIELWSRGSYSEVLWIASNKDFDYEGAYRSISRSLPGTFYIYIPPEEEFGIDTDYPYMLNSGNEMLFIKP